MDLKRHEITHGEIDDRPHQCDICGHGFARNDHLLKHMMSHERKAEKRAEKKAERKKFKVN